MKGAWRGARGFTAPSQRVYRKFESQGCGWGGAVLHSWFSRPALLYASLFLRSLYASLFERDMFSTSYKSGRCQWSVGQRVYKEG